MEMKIYTKTGDQGKTKLVNGEEIDKHHVRLECYGTVDELNSFLGLAISLAQLERTSAQVTSGRPAVVDLRSVIERVQNELFNLGSQLATNDPAVAAKLPTISNVHIEKLEREIDLMTAELPALRSFILPGGDAMAAQLHVARTVCRRAERLVTRLNFEAASSAKGPDYFLMYLNRLSDWLFTAARYRNLMTGNADQIWTKE